MTKAMEHDIHEFFGSGFTLAIVAIFPASVVSNQEQKGSRLLCLLLWRREGPEP
jgi:hypothetical protein